MNSEKLWWRHFDAFEDLISNSPAGGLTSNQIRMTECFKIKILIQSVSASWRMTVVGRGKTLFGCLPPRAIKRTALT
ncbi:hypothetical protein A3K24_00145 [candidate division Kazan bacterium RIFCSPHIGHO2_01_FULL_44_14]|uniref:Uncharacterized protein n=1 Tax=candidate division Kazan bacterium RIFCSPLOWO2_01_FULL_45_19 TaxID=1798538 RepID=A0A1F4NPQ7_UNCK3|nr:MAG: hypothetical protein A3K51_00145 [candidate division Kazan bacterium RIFCSPLOWO2_01_FULL_45_19]OGB77523.1 MAG: hypothetical protein A3K24_00145 [candidate division Kazan bacterium RIFCSPHIGHO2_01_FULL_44_14]